MNLAEENALLEDRTKLDINKIILPTTLLERLTELDTDEEKIEWSDHTDYYSDRG